jgi:hypothetical protein
MNTFLPDGVWSCESINSPGETEFMVIDTAKKRIVSFMVMNVNPVRRFPVVQLWYKQITSGLIHTRRKDTAKWHEEYYESDGASVSWIKSHGTYSWTRVSPPDVPDWLDESLDRVYTEMDQHPHSAEQGAAANP